MLLFIALGSGIKLLIVMSALDMKIKIDLFCTQLYCAPYGYRLLPGIM